MVTEIRYINIREVLSRILRHPLLQDVNLEQAIQYTLDFIGIFGLPDFYTDKEADIEVNNYMGQLPCDLISINMVKDKKTDVPLRSMTSFFNPGGIYYHAVAHEPQFKTQGRNIITSFACGVIRISYKAIPVDDEGYPLLVDNAKYLKALELYIRCQAFTYLFDLGKISQHVLNHTEQEYAWASGQLEEEFNTLSISEMESLTNMLNQMIVRKNEFNNRFERLGNREHRVIHNGNNTIEGATYHMGALYHGSHHEAPDAPMVQGTSGNKPVHHPEPIEEKKHCHDKIEALTEDEIDRIINQPMI